MVIPTQVSELCKSDDGIERLVSAAIHVECERCAQVVHLLAEKEKPGSHERFVLELAVSAIRARKP